MPFAHPQRCTLRQNTISSLWRVWVWCLAPIPLTAVMIHPRVSLSNIILDQDQEFLFLWRKRMGVSVGSGHSDTVITIKVLRIPSLIMKLKGQRIQGRWTSKDTKLGTAIPAINKVLCYHICSPSPLMSKMSPQNTVLVFSLEVIVGLF